MKDTVPSAGVSCQVGLRIPVYAGRIGFREFFFLLSLRENSSGVAQSRICNVRYRCSHATNLRHSDGHEGCSFCGALTWTKAAGIMQLFMTRNQVKKLCTVVRIGTNVWIGTEILNLLGFCCCCFACAEREKFSSFLSDTEFH